MISRNQLTDEQKAVVRHGTGPAVVRAVPGAGKTTALVHRIRRLVDERDVAPGHILASSFSRATVQDLKTGLNALGVRDVNTRTLHSLGLAVLRRSDRGTVPNRDDAPAPDAAARILARRALSDLAAERDRPPAELGISAQELVDQVAAWKQQLAYPAPDAAGLSPAAREQVCTATHENEDFVALYRRFESRRRHDDWLTYPDMLREAWRVLLNDDTLRTNVQDAYRFVLVDEFQDVSRVQFLLLDLLTAEHRNYMAIGDGDQCIYGWRGADPSFLANLDDRYDATVYPITDSFRLPAAPLVLANEVIAHNEERSPKRLRLTQGFTGRARLHEHKEPAAAASSVAETVAALRTEEGYALDDIAVLVRTYGQTPPLERAFIDHGLPYRLSGHEPFYRRREVQTLLQYLYWAFLERRRREHGWFDDAQTAARYADRFARILKTPTRYVQHGRIDRVAQQARSRQTSALEVLTDHLSAMHERTADRVEHFLDVAEALVDRLDDPPADTLDWLIDAIDYEAALRERSAFAERGDARVRTARALVHYAAAHDDAPALLRAVRSLAAHRPYRVAGTAALDLRSIPRAKGAEWPVVIVPGCTEGTLPLDADEKGERDLEEERRLFYVAVTRPTEQLHLVPDGSETPSRFLDEARVDTRLTTVRKVKTALHAEPSTLSTDALAALCRGLSTLGLDRYLRDWWAPSAEKKAALRARLDALDSAVASARKQRAAHRQLRAEQEAHRQTARRIAADRTQELQSVLGTAALSATNEQPDTYYPPDARLTFAWVDEETHVGLFWDGTRAGTLDPFGPHRLDAGAILDLPWDAMVGRFESVAQGRSRLHFVIDWSETEAALTQQAAQNGPSPPSLDERTRILTSDAFRHGYDRLRCALQSSPTHAH
jgi:DNA helicase-2/ATP-dependent DNA helicase PcrA